ncbi:RagB/SusD family nutrient uptake outer membrane protein [Siphonobacter sp. BAB-5385]|uniref:RagB/SusD family nutrient uptake outer membrane protein n=1 Tax=Siphonobacter sp. BAB-5385 TaxID=1864822 RepID=UPI000B9E11F4|nr:RagB/SusD family nutrient uptake outer membrane protein [Siphonobacter sp. BAB-5385]OZI05845.1 RagB/SusD family nutrient uptake outer membrane protein [Siphonobacter sp. BAB-5385]
MKNILFPTTRRIVTSLLTLLTATIVPSCKSDFFDKQPLDAISDATFWKTEKDANLALVGCYNFGSGWASGDFFGGMSMIYLDMMAGLGSEKELIPDAVTNGTLNSTYWLTGAFWSNSYVTIARCNNFLDRVNTITINETTKAMMVAEVKTIRAYLYLNLATYFGDVPMPTKTLTIAEANSIRRTPKAEVWAFAENELKSSFPNLPSTRPVSERGRITSGASLAILGRLQMAEKKWSDAVATYKRIIDSGVYSVDQAGFAQLFRQTGENSKEVVFAHEYLEDFLSTVMLQYLYPEAYGGWHQFSPYNELVQSYECTDGKTVEESPLYKSSDPYANRDPRLDYTIMISGRTTFKGITYEASPTSTSPDRITRYNWSGYCINKFMDPSFSGSLTNYGGNFPLIRYPEVLLSYLESKLEAGEAIDQALLNATINQVRGRSSVAMPAVTTTNPASLRTIIRRERKVEFAFEGLHYFDIQRWGTAAAELNRQFTGMKLTNTPATYTAFPVDSQGFYLYQKRNFVAGRNELWPVPQSERDINPNLTQNPGY